MKSKGFRNAASAPTRKAVISRQSSNQKEYTPTSLEKVAAATAAWRTTEAPKPSDPPLIRVLLKEASRRGHQMTQMSAALDCTYGYITQLRSGHRHPQHIGQDFANKAAAYLGVPPAVVKLLAGRVTVGDFVWPQRSRADEVAACLQALREDVVVGSFIPDELYAAAPAVQDFVWRLYEECSGQHPLGMRALPQALDYLQRAALNADDYETKLAELRDQMSQASVAAD